MGRKMEKWIHLNYISLKVNYNCRMHYIYANLQYMIYISN